MPERLAPNPWLVKWTHDEIDAGADIVVMHGAPLLHGVEIYRGRADLLRPRQLHLQPAADADLHRRADGVGERRRVVQFDPDPELVAVRGETTPEVDLAAAGRDEPDRRRAAGRAQPVRQQRVSPHARPAGSGDRRRAGYILQRLADASKPFGTTIEIRGDTATIAVGGRSTSRTPRDHRQA